MQACKFRDEYEVFKQAGAEVASCYRMMHERLLLCCQIRHPCWLCADARPCILLQIIGVSGGQPAENAAWATAQRLTFPLLTDEGAACKPLPACWHKFRKLVRESALTLCDARSAEGAGC